MRSRCVPAFASIFGRDVIRFAEASNIFRTCGGEASSGNLEDEWNEGRIKYLVADPRSLGHGLNLQKGGRIGRVQAMAGSLLNLKPVITVDKVPGTYVTVAKGRSMSKSIALIADPRHGLTEEEKG